MTEDCAIFAKQAQTFEFIWILFPRWRRQSIIRKGSATCLPPQNVTSSFFPHLPVNRLHFLEANKSALIVGGHLEEGVATPFDVLSISEALQTRLQISRAPTRRREKRRRGGTSASSHGHGTERASRVAGWHQSVAASSDVMKAAHAGGL